MRRTLFLAALILGLAGLAACQKDLEISPSTLPDGVVGVPYQAAIFVRNNETPVLSATVINGSLPPGLVIGQPVQVDNADSIPITGTPTQAGIFSFRLRIACYGTNVSGQDVLVDYTITIQ